MSNILITGGAGFIGCNYAARLLTAGHSVTVLDNLSRKGAAANLAWLQQDFGDALDFISGDVRDAEAVAAAARGRDAIFHLAAQVAVTSSVSDPRDDFETNALGTFNVLEGARLAGTFPLIVYASTNKVYGGMEGVRLVEGKTRWEYADLPYGLPETQPLDFHSPYGCSKGAGDQYVRDYARIYGMNTVVFRQSCLAADQEVVTPFGRKPIADLCPGDLVHSGAGWTRVKRAWQTGFKPVRRLTTMNGFSVSLTEDHRVFRPHGLYTNRDFAYGDFLAVLPEAHFSPQWEPIPDQVLDARCYLDAVRARTSDARCLNEAERIAFHLLPLQGDRLLAITEVAGRLFGDGHLGIHQRQSRKTPAYTVQHFGKEAELMEVSQRLAWLDLPTSGIVRWSATSTLPQGHIIQGQSCRIQQQSIPVFTLFELLGVPVGDKVRVDYELPGWVARGHRLVKRAFLRGFFGAELTKVNPDSYIAPSFAQSKDVTHRESGMRWVQQLRDLLAEFGIETSCFEADPVEYKRGTTCQVTVRLLGGRSMFEKLAEIGYAFSPERSTRLNALLRWQCECTLPDRFEAIEGLYRADGQLFWDSLWKIESLAAQPVYDIEVEAPTHLFVAGGIQVSNCIYGPRQFGIEDQGWLAHFVIAAATGRPISIYGDGKQLRDMLWIDDLMNAYDAALADPDRVAGCIYNLGGGPDFTFSIWREVEPLLTELAGAPLEVRYDDWRPGDQRVFVCDIRTAARDLSWQPTVSPEEGLRRLWEWVNKNIELFGA